MYGHFPQPSRIQALLQRELCWDGGKDRALCMRHGTTELSQPEKEMVKVIAVRVQPGSLRLDLQPVVMRQGLE